MAPCESGRDDCLVLLVGTDSIFIDFTFSVHSNRVGIYFLHTQVRVSVEMKLDLECLQDPNR